MINKILIFNNFKDFKDQLDGCDLEESQRRELIASEMAGFERASSLGYSPFILGDFSSDSRGYHYSWSALHLRGREMTPEDRARIYPTPSTMDNVNLETASSLSGERR